VLHSASRADQVNYNLLHLLLVFLAAAAAGAVNAVAGGGTLLTFPALLATGQPALLANATSTVALWPGTIGSTWGYRKETRENRRLLAPFLILGLLGGAVGSYLLLVTPAKLFDRIVPFLILTATGLLLAQEPISRWIRSRSGLTAEADEQATVAANAHLSPLLLLVVFLTAIYGGYFGAGIGIITLAALSLIGFRDMHQMNALKSVFALSANGIAAAIFIFKGLVDWRVALLMSVGALIGGYAGAGVARKIGQKNVRRVVIAIGLILAVSMLLRR
jgi:uncharacterized membrane protein YfcA